MVTPSTFAHHERVLGALLLLYCLASLIHFTHNAQFLSEYPNLPAWLTRFQVYAAWCCISAIGLVGYLVYRRGWRLSGLTVLAIYAVIGFDGLLHYDRAPLSAHTAAMNFTIWFEVVAAAIGLGAILQLAGRLVRHRPAP